jgi:transcriptional regulator with XRE-family HTH domain
MRERGWSASELARQIDVVPSLISRWMQELQSPSIESPTAIADAMHLSRQEVLLVAGHLIEGDLEDDPRRLEITRKLGAIDLTHDRYMTLNALLNLWLGAEASASGETGADTEAARPAQEKRGEMIETSAYNSIMTITPFADWIKRFRLHMDETQEAFARGLDVSVNTVYRWVSGSRMPSAPVLLLLRLMAEQHDFESPPEVRTKHRPRKN